MSKLIEPVGNSISAPPGSSAEEIPGIETSGLAPFRMASDARARRVARDLRDLLQSEGVKVNLTRAQALTAALYGYGSWPEMLSDLGPDTSLDDPDEDPGEVIARARRARGVVLTVLPSLPAADRLLAALQPTNRAVLSSQRPTVCEIINPNVYHPVRLKRLVEESEAVSAALGEIEADPAGAFRDVDVLERLGRAAHDVVDAAIAGEEMTLLPYDAYAMLQRRLLPLYAGAIRAEAGVGTIVDAEAVAIDLSERAIADLVGPADHYVHLGALRFPSPYPGLGIEGCYVRTCPDGDIVISAVLSPPAFGEDAEEYLDEFPTAEMLMAHARGHTMRLLDIIDGGLSVGLAPYADRGAIGTFDAQGRPPFGAGLDTLWRKLLRPVSAAAVNAVAWAQTCAPEQRVLGLAGSWDGPLARRLTKARTPQQLGAVSATLREAGIGPIVQILGTTQTAAETGFIPDALPAAPPFWPVTHGETWLALFARGGTTEYDFEESADLVYDYARLVAPDRTRFHALGPQARAQVLEAGHVYLTRLLIAEDAGAACEIADEMLALGSDEDARYHAVKAHLLIEEGRDAEAEAALVALEASDPMAAAWLRFHRAHLRQDAHAAHLLRLAYESDIPLAEALHRALGEGVGDFPDGPLAASGVGRGVQLLMPLLVELRPAITDLLRSLRVAPRASQARH